MPINGASIDGLAVDSLADDSGKIRELSVKAVKYFLSADNWNKYMESKFDENTNFKDEITSKIGVLMRRETEARILIPFLQDLYNEFGKEKILCVLEKTIKEIAKSQGKDLSKEYGDNVDSFLDTLKFWAQDGALEIDLLEKTDSKLNFNVTRCKYAEMYRALGASDLGAVLSCNRDAALIEGFNPKASLDRKETIMSGDKCCTFRYTFEN